MKGASRSSIGAAWQAFGSIERQPLRRRLLLLLTSRYSSVRLLSPPSTSALGPGQELLLLTSGSYSILLLPCPGISCALGSFEEACHFGAEYVLSSARTLSSQSAVHLKHPEALEGGCKESSARVLGHLATGTGFPVLAPGHS